jgi:hypothetical protein
LPGALVDHVIAWCAFLGAWLLVAGPLHQATRELEEEEIERDDMARAAAAVEKPPAVSGWWWLLPPVGYVLHRRRSNDYRRRVIAAMPSQKLAALESFRDKAEAWMFVAAGAFLIAVSETWALRDEYEWPGVVFGALIVLMSALCIANAAGRSRRRRASAESR